MEKWINVNSFLPEKHKWFDDSEKIITITVLVTNGKDIFMGYAVCSLDYKNIKWVSTHFDDIKNVTHWTHLPELPNYDNEKP